MDIASSPFNIGYSVRLPEFYAEQVLDLSRRHGLNWQNKEVEQLMQMVGGHPYLIRVALYHIAQNGISINQLIEEATEAYSPYIDHLQRLVWILQKSPNLIDVFKKIVMANEPVKLEPQKAFQLSGIGLIHLQHDKATVRCQLYRDYFRNYFDT